LKGAGERRLAQAAMANIALNPLPPQPRFGGAPQITILKMRFTAG
jgi:hypothetical protein